MFLLFVKSVISAEPLKKEPGQWPPPWRKITVPPVSCSPAPLTPPGSMGARGLGRSGQGSVRWLLSPPLLELAASRSSSSAAAPPRTGDRTSGGDLCPPSPPACPASLQKVEGAHAPSPSDVTAGLPSAVVDKSLDILVLSAETLKSDSWLLEGLVHTIKCQPAHLQPADVRRLGHALSTLVDNSTS